ncbi:MAG: hypothetical protein RLY78_3157 [Pseudomonadota bacterium]|uniref:Flagellar hook-associated protein 1 n=1 Tax=Pseudaquabacterium rugosum TaxID=2984194 RepID=A0ABU9B642_9BURK
MSASELLNIGTRAIFASYRQVQTTANNISNANTPGYSRQDVRLETAGSQETSGGYVGRGVNVATVKRASDAFLSSQVNQMASVNGTDAARSTLLSQLEELFGRTGTGVGAAAGQIFDSFADVAAAPSDLSAREVVLGRLEDFASLARANAQALADLQAQTQDDLRTAVAEVNGRVRNVAELNVKVTAALQSGHDPNELLDQRDQLVREIAAQIEVHSYEADNGQIALFLSNGENLVLGATSNELLAQPDAADPSRLQLGIEIDAGLLRMSSRTVGEGRLAGLMQFQNQDLMTARAHLGQVVASVTGMLNQQQALGLDLQGDAGSPLFVVRGPQVIPGADNLRTAEGNEVSALGATIEDPTALRASEYQVEALAAGGYQVTRLEDGHVFAGAVQEGDVIDGFSLAVPVGGSAPQAGETYRVQPSALAADDLQVALRSPYGLAAAGPMTAAAALDNTGTVGVSALEIESAPAAGSHQALTVRFTDDAGAYEVLDADGAVQDSGQYQAGQAIRFDGMKLTLSGLPKTGDLLELTPTVHVSLSNGNALTMQQFAQRTIAGGQTPTDAFAHLLADVGVRSQSAQTAAGHSATALGTLNSRLASATGVNLDEEAAQLIQFQQNYQAAAKVLQTAQTLLDTVIQLAGS